MSSITDNRDDSFTDTGLRRGSRREADLLYVVYAATLLALLILGLWNSSSSIATVCSYLLLVGVTLFMYYRNFGSIRMIGSLAFPLIGVVLIQVLVYPLYILITGNSRDYLFEGGIPTYAPAMLLWAVSLVGFGIGLAMRKRRRAKEPAGGALEVSDSMGFSGLSTRGLVIATLPLMALSLIAAYARFRAYGVVSLQDLANLGAFSADVIRRNRGLGVLALVETWSYVAVAYVGWHAYAEKRLRRSRLLLGACYALAGSVLSLLNARRSVLVIHVALLLLPFVLDFLWRRRAAVMLLPVVLGGMFALDLVTSQARTSYYATSEVDVVQVVELVGAQGYAPLSFNHLELSAALLQQVESNRFEPMLGRTFGAALVNWVPRSLWPGEKPWTAGPYFSIAMGGNYYFDDSGSSSAITTGLLVEFIMNFGLFAFALLPPVMTVVAYVLSGIDIVWILRRRSLLGLTAFSVFCWNAAGLMYDDLGAVITKVVMMLSGLVVLWVLKSMLTRRPLGAVRQAVPAIEAVIEHAEGEQGDAS